MTVRLGYACINETLNKKGKDGKKSEIVCCNKTCRLATLISKGEETGLEKKSKGYSAAIYTFLTDMGLNNLKAMYKILQWSKNNNILFYRISSDLIPHVSNNELTNHMTEEDYTNYFNLTFAEEILVDIGKYVQKYGMRLTFHPDHFNQLGSKNPLVVFNTFKDLMWHARVLDILEVGAEAYINYKKSQDEKYREENVITKDSTLCVHMGGKYDDKKAAIARWKSNFQKLPENVKRRVCIENCEKSYCADDILPICEELKIPMIFDFHHYDCWEHYHKESEEKERNQSSLSYLMPKIFATWKNSKYGEKTPKFHLSDQAPNKNVGAHDDYVEDIPDILLAYMKEKYISFDIMIEAKKKELAVIKLKRKYGLL